MSAFKKPPVLKAGSRIAVIAPASSFDRESFERGIQKIRDWGFKAQYREDIFERQRYLAGSDERRAEELSQALQDPSIDAVLMARGGYGSMRLLPFLDRLPTDLPPKIVLGYSDITALLIYLYQRWGWVSFHGPVVAKDLGDRLSAEGELRLQALLSSAQPLGELSCPDLVALHPGRAQGALVGGCLSLIVALSGTPYALDTRGKILYLEDTKEPLYSLDRMLTQLRLAGALRELAGIVFGPLQGAHENEAVVRALLEDLLQDLKIPVLFGFPSGHQDDSWTIPLGLPVLMDSDRLCMTFLENALV